LGVDASAPVTWEEHMKKGFAVCAVLMTLGHGLVGCGGSNASYNPFSPSPPLPPPPLPPRTLAVDLTGNYALTFDVGNACEEVPKDLRRRTYEATIAFSGSYGSADLFLAELSGATFRDQRAVSIEVAPQPSGYSVWLDFSDNVILEEPERGTYFMIAASGAATVQPTELFMISTPPITGYFNYCVVGPQNQCSSSVMVRSLCKSENSRWTLVRR
jgi:hypothetical protein